MISEIFQFQGAKLANKSELRKFFGNKLKSAASGAFILLVRDGMASVGGV